MPVSAVRNAISLGTQRAAAGRAVRHIIAITDTRSVKDDISADVASRHPDSIHVTGSDHFRDDLTAAAVRALHRDVPTTEMCGDWAEDIKTIFVHLCTDAESAGKAVVLCVTDMDDIPTSDLGTLIEIVHKVAQRNAPLMFVGIGGEGIGGRCGDARSYAERLFSFIPVENNPRPDM